MLTGQTDGRTNGRQTVTLRFPLDAASVMSDRVDDPPLRYKLDNSSAAAKMADHGLATAEYFVSLITPHVRGRSSFS